MQFGLYELHFLCYTKDDINHGGICEFASFRLEKYLLELINYIFIITPAIVDISGDFQEILSGSFDVPINNGF